MTAEEAKKRIDELIDKIDYYNQRYYQDSVSEITDYEFDQLLKELEKLEKNLSSVQICLFPNPKSRGYDHQEL
jgi:NAD-dependent DNA ligase